MRAPLVFLLFSLTICINHAWAEDQERKLIDRLLRPDMTLINPAQDKQFSGAGGTVANKNVEAKPFYSGDELATMNFAGIKDFAAKKLRAKTLSNVERAGASDRRADCARLEISLAKSNSFIRTTSDEAKRVETRSYSGSHAFRGKGTRQEILRQQDRPLTIEEVRQLLNKNK